MTFKISTFGMHARSPLRTALLVGVALGLALGAGPSALAAPAERADEVRRVLMLLRAMAEEYREAFDAEGRLVRPIELEEARLLLAEAQDHAGRLGEAVPAELGTGLASLARALETRVPLAALDTQVDALCRTVAEATGVREELLPPAPPSPARGAALFQEHCVSCHGARGAGDGPEARHLERKPGDFTDPAFMRGETPADFFHVISVGRRQGAMPAWDAVLSVQERWDTVSHLFSLAATSGETREGQGIFLAHCAGCHGAVGDGAGAHADVLAMPVPDLTAPGALTRRSDTDLFVAVTEGLPGTAMPAFARTLSEADRWKVVGFLRRLSLGEFHPAATDGISPRDTGAAAALADVRRLVAAAAEAHRRGDPAAVTLASDAYLRFEPIERELAARDAAAVHAVEEEFLGLRGALRQPGADVTPLAAAVGRALDRAEAALESQADAWARFVQSAAIILREGFEVVLILGALLAWATKSGNAAMRRPIWAGALAGVGASLVTAVLIASVFRLTAVAAEILEGVAMLLASAVLFWVSWWIVSKAEAERWQRYIRGKVERAVATGSGTALAAAGFLAVYREGFETVLFYRALLAGAPAGDVMVPAGFVVGLAALAVVYVVLSRIGLRIPIRQFFLATGGLLLVMAITFAGKGVHELQEAGVVSITAVAWAPRIKLLGVYPTLETLLAQGILLALVVYAGVLTLRRGRRRESDVLAAIGSELHALREVAEALRTEVGGLPRAGDPRREERLRSEIESVLARVTDLEARVSPGNGRN